MGTITLLVLLHGYHCFPQRICRYTDKRTVLSLPSGYQISVALGAAARQMRLQPDNFTNKARKVGVEAREPDPCMQATDKQDGTRGCTAASVSLS